VTASSREPFWLFMHIPKAAGTTLRSIVDAQYGADAVLTYYNQNSRQLLDNLRYVLMDERRGYRALIGHFSFGVHEGLPRPARYITFLREPVARAISSYAEVIKTDPGRYMRGDGTTMSLAEAVDRYPQAFANQQLKMVGGFEHDCPMTRDHLATAEANLASHFDFVGTMERFDEAVLLLSRFLGWSPCEYGQLNRSAKPPHVDPQLRHALETLNELECTLYAGVAQRLGEVSAADQRASNSKRTMATAAPPSLPTASPPSSDDGLL
jgi:hypothetical protein